MAVTGFHSTFEIDSQAGQVIGTKTFSHSGDNNCSGAMPGGFLSAEAFASWDARITAGGRAYADSGTGFSSLHDHTGSTTRTMHFLGRLTSSRTEATPLDAEPPAISVTRPAEGASYLLGEPVTAAFSCDDGATGAGVSSCVGSVADGAALDTSSVGPKTFHVSARDNAGNASEKDVHYSVVWPFEGFFSPVNNQPTLNRVNAGRAIPIKFSLGGDRGLGVLADGYPKSQDVACDSTAPVDGVEETVSADSSGLSYDAASGRYVYVWKTDRAWAGTCRQLVLKLEDGSTHRVTFTFTD
jgi:hypothetical protein